ncbi:MAG: CBS domain-containing protein [Methanosarcina flavescens]|jgi:CBS domain-containing protein|uniref:CBS domain-containing protein n=2 Tax=Methanosarcina TaxID=2207 RepID=A0A660HTM9_9EURY|nr:MULTISPECIES: CBS domain-containing protein [Methanosarcina]AKB16567.1 CBS domain protein [Methanosarcina thermophila CHTI-55]AYK15678.1 CBS domain-containing protein [Methanosarcina flavescens]NLK31405.1 CBS domain-containing protein [Methanosarcina flavescens]
MKVKDVMNPNVVFCKPDNTVREAAKILKENNISGAPILEGGELVGIISEADLLKLLIVPEKGDLWLPSPFEVIEIPIRELIGWEETKRMLSDVGSTKIEEIMTKDVHTISSEASVEEASEHMIRHRINRLPVTEDSRVVGIITRGDIIKGLAKL